MATLDQTINILIGVGIVGIGMFVSFVGAMVYCWYLGWKDSRKVKIK